PTANLARAVNFYARAFGFRLLVGTGGRRPRRVVLHAARTRLALEEHGLEQRAARTRERARLHLQDFDAARERVWDLGIATTQDTASHDDAAAAGGRRRFVVRDPDGHEIEVVDRRAQ
ncbi:MAG TPA: VOC family protein, partial [Gammaproteobacteria bacterium]|nr:VOC family protein [Gammaproteobacteria bacterium]